MWNFFAVLTSTRSTTSRKMKRIELKDKPCTRRGILSTISSIYDPLGFIAPVVLVGKKILHDICHSNSWDEPVDDATRIRWEKWRNELCLLESLKVPRSFKPAEFGKIVSAQLHCMSDASTCGYMDSAHT